MIYESTLEEVKHEIEDGDVEDSYLFNAYNGKVMLIADMENISTDICVNLETMRFEVPRCFDESTITEASNDVRNLYPGGIEVEPYASTEEAINDYLHLYDGLYVRYYIATCDATIEELRKLSDGLIYVYVIKAKSEVYQHLLDFLISTNGKNTKGE